MRPTASRIDKARQSGSQERGSALSHSLLQAHGFGDNSTVRSKGPEPSPQEAKREAAQLKEDATKRVDSRTGLFGLDESALGSDLAAMSVTEQGIKAGNATLDAVNTTNRDDVSSQMVDKMSSRELQALAGRPGGKEFLQRAISHMNSGHVSGFEGEQIAKAGPFAFDRHGPLMDDKLSPDVTDAIKNAGATHQKLADGNGPVKFDEHSVTIDKMPPGMSPEQFLSNFAKDPNKTTDSGMFNLINRFERRSDVGDPKPGDIYDIDIFGPENGDVAIKKMEPNYFDVATLNTDRHGEHPEYGTRRFGFDSNEDGSHTFYTRGVSRNAEMLFDNGLAIRMGGGVQNYDWQQMVKGWGNAIDKLGGQQRPGSVRQVLGPR